MMFSINLSKTKTDFLTPSINRSALKKIHERDDTSVKSMVLCVSNIIQLPGHHGNNTANKTEADGKTDAVSVSVKFSSSFFQILLL